MSNSLSWCDNGVLEKSYATEAVVSILGCSERVGSGGGLVYQIFLTGISKVQGEGLCDAESKLLVVP